MIRNDRQYRIVHSRLDRLRELEVDLLERAKHAHDEVVAELELRTVRGEIDSMAAELADYQALQAGRAEVGVPETVADLPRILIRARIAAGLTQAELADRLGLKPQQIQRYEATDYESASLDRLREVADALDVRLAGTVAPPADSDLPTLAELFSRLDQQGVPRDLIRHRVLGPATPGDEPRTVVNLVARLTRLFNWDPMQILSGTVQVPAAAPAFKLPERSSQTRTAAYAAWAEYLVTVTLQATRNLPRKPLPANPIAWHDEIVAEHGAITFSSVLHSLWSHGVAVLPLAEPGGFHAATYRKAGRDVVVLKHGGAVESQWLFDMLHESGHIVDLVDTSDEQLIEDQPGEAVADNDAERRANEYALATAFGGRAPGLFDAVMALAREEIPKVKRATYLVAKRESVNEGLLALHVAHNLALRGHNWWGAAHNLQQPGIDPWQTARDAFVENVDWSAIGDLDRDLLSLALQPSPTPATHDTDTTP